MKTLTNWTNQNEEGMALSDTQFQAQGIAQAVYEHIDFGAEALLR